MIDDPLIPVFSENFLYAVREIHHIIYSHHHMFSNSELELAKYKVVVNHPNLISSHTVY